MGDHPAELLSALVAIDSVNPALVPGGPVQFGPSGAGAHAIEEWVSLADTATIAGVAERLCA